MGAYKSIITDIQCALEDGNLEAVFASLVAPTREDRAELLLTALELALGRYGDE
jgi:hypothetical protein